METVTGTEFRSDAERSLRLQIRHAERVPVDHSAVVYDGDGNAGDAS